MVNYPLERCLVNRLHIFKPHNHIRFNNKRKDCFLLSYTIYLSSYCADRQQVCWFSECGRLRFPIQSRRKPLIPLLVMLQVVEGFVVLTRTKIYWRTNLLQRYICICISQLFARVLNTVIPIHFLALIYIIRKKKSTLPTEERKRSV